MTARFRAGWALALVLLPAATFASGFLFGDNGARALSLGGAFAGQADDLTAIDYNPAGLTQIGGYSFLIDVLGLNHQVRFQRRDANGTTVANEVQNEGGMFVLPFIVGSYARELGGRRFTASVGVYEPPSVGRYAYPRPDYSKTEQSGSTTFKANPIKFAPQRYGLISDDLIIVFPSVSASYELINDRLSVGATGQYVYAQVNFSQAVTSVAATPTSQLEEDPDFDSILTVRTIGQPAFTGVFGVMARPTDFLQIGVSYRPAVPLTLVGTTQLAPGAIPSQSATVRGNLASLTLTLPQELRAGVHVTPWSTLGVNADFVYQGWQSVDEFVLTPENVTLQSGNGEQRAFAPIHFPKNWHHSVSARFGAEYRFGFGMTARAGVLWEQSAIPRNRLHIDFLHPTRTFITGGVEYGFGPLSVVLTGAYTPIQQVEISNSVVTQTNTDPAVPGSVIGNGTYRSGGWIVGLGVRGSFGAAGPARSSSRDASQHGVLQL